MDSESRLQGSLSNDRPVPIYVVPYMDRDDEVSLIDLWRVVVARKVLVLLSLLVAIILASAYIFLAEPSYRAEADLLPPQQQDVQALMINYSTMDMKSNRYSPSFVYAAFLRNLKSKGLRREYFDTHDLATYYLGEKKDVNANIDRIFDNNFNGSFRMQIDKQDASFVTIGFVNKDPILAAEWLNQFIKFANERTIRQLVNGVNVTIQAEIERIRYQLESKLKLAVQRRQDRMVKLREALYVAKTLGIQSTGSFSVMSGEKDASIEVNTAQLPLYMRGTKALEAEIAVLETRKSNEPFIVGLRNLQEKRAFLEAISVERDEVTAVSINSAARTPYRMESPRKEMIIMLGVVSGLIVGVFLVLIAEFWSKMRKQSEQYFEQG